MSPRADVYAPQWSAYGLREQKWDQLRAVGGSGLQLGAIAEVQGHHPDIYLAWGKVEIKIWTHKINGLSESDFVLAAKIDKL